MITNRKYQMIFIYLLLIGCLLSDLCHFLLQLFNAPDELSVYPRKAEDAGD